MKFSSFEIIVRTLNEAAVRYLVVGGVAVNAHGYGRNTYDVDMVLALEPENIARAFVSLREVGYEPILPVTADQFSNQELRERWNREKGMIVLQMCGDLHRETPLDIFVREPFDFATEYAEAVWLELATGVKVPLIRLEALLEMKRSSGRPKDLADLDELSLLYGRLSSYDQQHGRAD